MDRLDEMKVFARVVETRSFRQAARDLGLPASTVTDVVKRSEKRLGVRLLDRTTRLVSPTLDGEAWYRRCLAIVAQVEDAEAAFRGGAPHGRLHISISGVLARHALMPRLPAFLAAYPGVDLVLSEDDRLVDLVRAGIDCAVRVGRLGDGDLIARRLGRLPEVTVAAPAYLAAHGAPHTLDDLSSHRIVGFLSSATGAVLPLEFTCGSRVVERSLPASLVVTSAESLVAAGRLGLGLIQVPRYHVAEDLAAGRLVEVLPDMPPSPSPVSALYPRDRHLSPRVRVLLEWISSIDFGERP